MVMEAERAVRGIAGLVIRADQPENCGRDGAAILAKSILAHGNDG